MTSIKLYLNNKQNLCLLDGENLLHRIIRIKNCGFA